MDHAYGSTIRSSTAYQVMLVTLLSVNFGIVFFDRNALNFLMPFVQPELGLSNTQVGILASALSLTWACAAFGIGVISDRTGSRKGLLILATLAFSNYNLTAPLLPGNPESANVTFFASETSC